MRDANEIATELVEAFSKLKVKGTLIQDSQFFEDYVRIGATLSEGPRSRGFISRLQPLETEMERHIQKWYSRKARAISHFERQETHYSTNQNGAAPKDRDFSHLLSNALATFERRHGFIVVGDKLPNYAGFVFGKVFKEGLGTKQHWKDVGAGASHGEFTHRLQWYLVIASGAIRLTRRGDEALVFGSIVDWQKGKTNLWTYLVDKTRTDDQYVEQDRLDFRCPENFQDWLTGPDSQASLPLLRAFLRARKAKRESQPGNLPSYIQKKLGVSEEQLQEIMQGFANEIGTGLNPSARIVYPSNQPPELSKFSNS